MNRSWTQASKAYNGAASTYDFTLPGNMILKSATIFVKNTAWTTNSATVFTLHPLVFASTGTIVEGASLGTWVTTAGDATTTNKGTLPSTWGTPLTGNHFRVKATQSGSSGANACQIECIFEIAKSGV